MQKEVRSLGTPAAFIALPEKKICLKMWTPPELWTVWISMRSRCNCKTNNDYDRYGGRGITVCERWQGRNGFKNFVADVGPRPSPRHTLDRWPDNDGNYEPGNVRWATRKEQANNRRRPDGPISAEGKISLAIKLAVQYGGIDGAHHKDWVIDQMVRILAGDRYETLVRKVVLADYSWNVGIAP